MNADDPQGLVAPIDPATELFRQLVATGKWLKFLAIAGLIGIGAMVVAGLAMLVGDFPGNGSLRFVGVVYIVIAPIYLLLLLPLLRSARESAGLRSAPSLEGAARAFGHQATFWRRYGVLMIVALALSVVAIVIGLVVGLAGLGSMTRGTLQ